MSLQSCIINVVPKPNLGIAPQKHWDVLLTKLPSNSRGVFRTTFLVKPTMYLTNFEDLRIEAMIFLRRSLFNGGTKHASQKTPQTSVIFCHCVVAAIGTTNSTYDVFPCQYEEQKVTMKSLYQLTSY